MTIRIDSKDNSSKVGRNPYIINTFASNVIKENQRILNENLSIRERTGVKDDYGKIP